MKKLKGIINEIKTATDKTTPQFNQLLWQLICYSPKMPVRYPVNLLLDEAKKFNLKALDVYFTQSELDFNGFIWGEGSNKILLTHGWASKAADFYQLITALREIPDTQIIAFDAPGNGSSEAEQSNLLIYVQAVKAIIREYGEPDILIGHSLGAMANVVTLNETGINPKLLISLTPLVHLKENFKATMDANEVPEEAQETFYADFRRVFNDVFSNFTLDARYQYDAGLNHWIAYDEEDKIAPYQYLQDFLSTRKFISSKAYNGAGHDKILIEPDMVTDVVKMVKENIR
jgi:hypothetical protein